MVDVAFLAVIVLPSIGEVVRWLTQVLLLMFLVIHLDTV